MFRGESLLNVDDKGRMAVPSRYREQLKATCGGSLVVTISLLHRCLTVYPAPDWQRIEDDLKRLPALDQKAQAIRHLLIGHATECELDSQGRILLTQSLREFASLDKRVKMVGQASKFELWDESAWAAHREDLLGRVEEILVEPSAALSELVL
jgi:MraZ protein